LRYGPGSKLDHYKKWEKKTSCPNFTIIVVIS